MESSRLGVSLEPNKRLRLLRSRMEEIENQARELEMTNFSEYREDADKEIEMAHEGTHMYPSDVDVGTTQDSNLKLA